MGGRIKWFSIVRTTGLLMVLLYHFFIDFLPGGFLGVDVFFTFSGYLMTALMIEECRKTSNFELTSYYNRRFMRIFPSLFLMVVAMLALALLISPDFTVGIGRQAAAALGFFTNYFEIATGGSYEAQLFPHLFVHTWSLAVEAHLYIIWGAVCALVYRRVRARFKNTPQRHPQLLKEWLCLVACVGAALSQLNMWMLYARSPDPSAAYFATTSHAFPFLIGAAAATLLGIEMPRKLRTSSVWGLAMCVLPLSIIGLFALAFRLDFRSASTYRFGFLSASLLSVTAIWSARVLHEFTPKRTLEPRALSMAAELSYCIYLFHWPVYIACSQWIDSNWLAVLVTMLITIPLSMLVNGFADPILRGKRVGKTQMARAALVLVLIAITTFGRAAIARAPLISSVERELLIDYVYQDARNVYDFVDGYIALAAPPAPNYGLPEGVYVIGDSVCLGARRQLIQKIPVCTVDARGSRSIEDGYRILMRMQQRGELKEYIVVALGANVTENVFKRINQLIANLEPGHRLIFVTPYNGRLMSSTSITQRTAEYMRTLPDKFPFVTVADWAAFIGTNKQLLGSDRLHIGGNGQAVRQYALLIMQALDEAKAKPAKEAEPVPVSVEAEP